MTDMLIVCQKCYKSYNNKVKTCICGSSEFYINSWNALKEVFKTNRRTDNEQSQV